MCSNFSVPFFWSAIENRERGYTSSVVCRRFISFRFAHSRKRLESRDRKRALEVHGTSRGSSSSLRSASRLIVDYHSLGVAQARLLRMFPDTFENKVLAKSHHVLDNHPDRQTACPKLTTVLCPSRRWKLVPGSKGI